MILVIISIKFLMLFMSNNFDMDSFKYYADSNYYVTKHKRKR